MSVTSDRICTGSWQPNDSRRALENFRDLLSHHQPTGRPQFIMESSAEHPDALALLAEADWVHRLARSLLQDAHLAADAAQDALVAAIQRPPEFALDRRRLRSWLARVVRNRAVDLLRRRRETSSLAG